MSWLYLGMKLWFLSSSNFMIGHMMFKFLQIHCQPMIYIFCDIIYTCSPYFTSLHIIFRNVHFSWNNQIVYFVVNVYRKINWYVLFSFFLFFELTIWLWKKITWFLERLPGSWDFNRICSLKRRVGNNQKNLQCIWKLYYLLMLIVSS